MEEKKQPADEQDERNRIKRAEQFQREEAERKRREANLSPQGMRKILEGAKSKILTIYNEAQYRGQMTMSWTDASGTLRRYTGPWSSMDIEASKSPDLLVRSNQKSVMAILRACQRVGRTIESLFDVLATSPKALPLDLEKYMNRLVSEIPSLDTIKLEVTREPKRAAPANDDDSANG